MFIVKLERFIIFNTHTHDLTYVKKIPAECSERKTILLNAFQQPSLDFSHNRRRQEDLRY